MEQTLVLLKPDALHRSLLGEILTRIERTGLKPVALDMIKPTEAQAHYTYEDIALRHGEAVRNQLIAFLTSDPIIALAVEGDCAISVVRKLCGSTEPATAMVGTIRGDYAHHSFDHAKQAGKPVHNLIHASANLEDAKREIAVWFKPHEIFGYHKKDEKEHNLTL